MGIKRKKDNTTIFIPTFENKSNAIPIYSRAIIMYTVYTNICKLSFPKWRTLTKKTVSVKGSNILRVADRKYISIT